MNETYSTAKYYERVTKVIVNSYLISNCNLITSLAVVICYITSELKKLSNYSY